MAAAAQVRGHLSSGNASRGAGASHHGKESAIRPPAVHPSHQGYGGNREPHAARHPISYNSYPRISVPSPMGTQHGRVLGQPMDPACGGARLLSAAPADGAHYDQRGSPARYG